MFEKEAESYADWSWEASTSVKRAIELAYQSSLEIEDGKDDDYTHFSITEVWSYLIDKCEFLRQKYNKIIENKKYLKELIMNDIESNILLLKQHYGVR